MLKSSGLRPRLRYLASAIVSLALLAILVQQSQYEQLLQSAANVSIALVFASYSVTLMARLLESIALASSLKSQQAQSSVLVALQSAAVANLAGFIAPGDMASGVAKWAYLNHSSRNPAAALRTVISLRLVLLSLATSLSLAASIAFPNALVTKFRPLQIVVILLICLALRSIWSRSSAALLARGASLSKKISILSWAGSPSFANSRRPAATEILAQVVTLAASTLLAATGLALVLSATGSPIPFGLVLYVYGFLLLARQLPITFAGIGLRELVLIEILQPFGLASEQLIVAGLLLLGPQILLALVGLTLIARFPNKSREVRDA